MKVNTIKNTMINNLFLDNEIILYRSSKKDAWNVNMFCEILKDFDSDIEFGTLEMYKSLDNTMTNICFQYNKTNKNFSWGSTQAHSFLNKNIITFDEVIKRLKLIS